MEHSHKNTDCYFFYYSTCKKGELCPFRHEPSALGCETMCSYWQQGNCLNEHCSFRHMELKKNRKSIPCYWETQPSGCRKPHCPFLHKNVRAIYDPINPVKATEVTSKPINQDWVNRQDDAKYDTSSAESDQGRGSSEAGSFIGSPAVDPLIVKFGEESDNESVPSPVKTQPQPRVPRCKTDEQIRLEEIQAESAAYYSYNDEDSQGVAEHYLGKYYSMMNNPYPKVVFNNITTSRRIVPTRGIRRKIRVDATTVRTIETKKEEDNNREEDESMMPEKKKMKIINNNNKKDNNTNELNFQVLSLEEIRRRKKHKTLTQGVELLENVKSDLSKLFDQRTPPPPTNDLSKNPTETSLNVHIISNVMLPINRGVKKVLEKDRGTTESDENNRRVKAKLDDNNIERLTKVPPVRLRRSAKRCLINIATNESVVSKQQQQDIPTTIINDNDLLLTSDQTSVRIDNKMNDIDADNESNKQNLTSRLDESLDIRVNLRDHSINNTTRKNEVEVRLCDSSTDEERMILEDESKTFNNYEENEKTKSVLMDTITEDSKASRLSCDSFINLNDDEYLALLDTASDDILKDIDALLKDKPVL